MDQQTIFLTLLGMMAVTYLPRALPVLALAADTESAAAAWALGCRGVMGRAADEEQLLALAQLMPPDRFAGVLLVG